MPTEQMLVMTRLMVVKVMTGLTLEEEMMLLKVVPDPTRFGVALVMTQSMEKQAITGLMVALVLTPLLLEMETILFIQEMVKTI